MEDNKILLPEVDKEKLVFVQQDTTIFDQKFETKKIGYLQDALIRFSKNKGSVVAFVILCIMILFSLIVPFFARYGVNEYDLVYANVLPKVASFEGSGFWDGTKVKVDNEKNYEYFYYHGAAEFISQDGTNVKFRFDSYENVGYQYLDLSEEEAIERILGRLTCSCGKSYNLNVDNLKPKVEGICDGCENGDRGSYCHPGKYGI